MPESAVAKVNEISRDPVSWWNQHKIQRAEDRFCYQFARVSDDWWNEWKDELLSIVKSSRKHDFADS